MATCRLLDSLQTFLDNLKVEFERSGNSTTNSTPAVFAFETFALQVQQLDPKEFKGQMFSVNLGSVEEARGDNRTIDQGALMTTELESIMNLNHEKDKSDIEGVMNTMADPTASLLVPEDLLDLCSDVETNSTSAVPQRLSYSVFKSDVLFKNPNQSKFSIGSIIVAARLKCADNITRNTSIKSIFQINKTVRFTISTANISLLLIIHISFVDGRKFYRKCMCNVGQRYITLHNTVSYVSYCTCRKLRG